MSTAMSRLSAVRVVGGLIPGDVITAVMSGAVDGLSSSDYHLGGESPREAAARAWTYLQSTYRRFRSALEALPSGDPAVAVTRERWLSQLFTELGYGRVPATPAGGITVGDGAAAKSYAVSHVWGATPIHQMGWGVDLDRRTPGVAGAARAPHAMVQELLNRSEDHLWAILTNGRALRLLRDSTTLTGFSFVEFDLEAIFDGELFSEFALLFLMVHESRVEVSEGAAPASCWLERWRTTAITGGVRALGLLRAGVEQALETLGTGFLQHPANEHLRQRLADNEITLKQVHASLLRSVYRFLFWSVVEDRGALLSPDATAEQRERYRDFFSSARLRELALKRHGSGHDDLWQGVGLVLGALGRQGGEPRLGLPGLGGLFTVTEADVLDGARLPNTALLAAVRALSVVQPKGEARRQVDFANLGPEELGSVYESLLELEPRHDPISHTYTVETLAGNDRKTSGSYYTPSELVELVLATALDPVLDATEKATAPGGERAEALLNLKVCDPAVGSAHFLVAAARRIALRVAVARTGEVDPTPSDYSDALHDVVGRCLYGVDLNPMAADLAKVSLWLTAMTPGKPLSFLDHHIKVGNGLLGTTPALLRDGVSDAAFTALTGDDKSTVTAWKKANKTERANRGDDDLFAGSVLDLDPTQARTITSEVDAVLQTASTLEEVAFAAQRYATLADDEDLQRQRWAADAWCAAILGEKTPDSSPITTAVVDDVAAGKANEQVLDQVRAIAARHRLFHWHLEFPEVFRVPEDGPVGQTYGWTGGFDVMLGNPPWDRVKLQEQEFFATRAPDIADAKNAAARKKAIAALENSERHGLFLEFTAAKRKSEAESQFLRTSGRFPLTGAGDVNTYQVFAEHFRSTLNSAGRCGILVPTGLVTNETTSPFVRDLLSSRSLVALYDFANHKENLFDGLKGQSWFAACVITAEGGIREARLAFDLGSPSEVRDKEFSVSAKEIASLNPNSGTIPVFRSRMDADITLKCYRQHDVLIHEGKSNPWGIGFATMFHMAQDSSLFKDESHLRELGAVFAGWAWTSTDGTYYPLYEGKMVWHFDHRHGSYEGYDLRDGTGVRSLPRPSLEQLNAPDYEVLPRYWVKANDIEARFESWTSRWFFGWREVSNVTNQRTFVSGVVPYSAVGHKFPLCFPEKTTDAPLLQSVWSSLIFDYIVRQKLSGTSMSYFIVRQLPCPGPRYFTEPLDWADGDLDNFVRPRVLELTYTSGEMANYARDCMCTDGVKLAGSPFLYDVERRAQIRAEIDAAMLHAYGLSRQEADYVLDSFDSLRKSEQRDLGEYRTKRLVLAAYDAMADAAVGGPAFVSPLDPPPGEGPRHPARENQEQTA